MYKHRRNGLTGTFSGTFRHSIGKRVQLNVKFEAACALPLLLPLLILPMLQLLQLLLLLLLLLQPCSYFSYYVLQYCYAATRVIVLYLPSQILLTIQLANLATALPTPSRTTTTNNDHFRPASASHTRKNASPILLSYPSSLSKIKYLSQSPSCSSSSCGVGNTSPPC